MISHILNFASKIHQGNVDAGWWSDLKTGESILHTRNRGELLGLTISELSEGSIGHANLQMDDKLPEYPMLDVEIADAVIRAGDLLGAELRVHGWSADALDIKSVYAAIEEAGYNRISIVDADVDIVLMKLTNIVSVAIEHFRKGRHKQGAEALIGFILASHKTFELSSYLTNSLEEIIQAKADFNSKREDHKLEHRRSDGGKKF